MKKFRNPDAEIEMDGEGREVSCEPVYHTGQGKAGGLAPLVADFRMG